MVKYRQQVRNTFPGNHLAHKTDDFPVLNRFSRWHFAERLVDLRQIHAITDKPNLMLRHAEPGHVCHQLFGQRSNRIKMAKRVGTQPDEEGHLQAYPAGKAMGRADTTNTSLAGRQKTQDVGFVAMGMNDVDLTLPDNRRQPIDHPPVKATSHRDAMNLPYRSRVKFSQRQVLVRSLLTDGQVTHHLTRFQVIGQSQYPALGAIKTRWRNKLQNPKRSHESTRPFAT